MTDKERVVRERDPLFLQQLLARLARIKMAKVNRETEELQRRWPHRNVVEEAYLRHRDEMRDHHASG
jgi:hypothetical protein